MSHAGSERRTCPQAEPRLDRWLASWKSVGSRKRASSLVMSGKVDIDGVAVGPDAGGMPVAKGAVVELHWNRPGTSKPVTAARSAMRSAGLSVLYEDARVVVVDKPPGLLTDTATRHQARNRDSVRARLATWLHAMDQHPTVVHRIDRDTSGIVVVARDEEAGEKLRKAFSTHVPKRTYLAWVHGIPDQPQGTWEDVVLWDPKVNIQKLSAPGVPGSATARGHWRIDQAFPRSQVARLEVQLDTGRRNQIRLQAALRGHPLVGETQYLPDGYKPRPPRMPRQALHARRIVFPHPDDGRPITVEAPLSDDLQRLEALLAKKG